MLSVVSDEVCSTCSTTLPQKPNTHPPFHPSPPCYYALTCAFLDVPLVFGSANRSLIPILADMPPTLADVPRLPTAKVQQRDRVYRFESRGQGSPLRARGLGCTTWNSGLCQSFSLYSSGLQFMANPSDGSGLVYKEGFLLHLAVALCCTPREPPVHTSSCTWRLEPNRQTLNAYQG